MEAQNRADSAIQSAQEDIDAARKDLSQVCIIKYNRYYVKKIKG